ncbi:small ribosomal subunit protein uS17-like [Microtus pennsylvanicus]|uniref:small ribosomal subunit protein uS17-like n=1 Tax=Microtus pennsylvanicus TaxID=10058 RepID=UPI003F6D9238
MEESRPLNYVLLSHIKSPTSGLAAFGTLSLGAESTDAASTDTENGNVLHGIVDGDATVIVAANVTVPAEEEAEDSPNKADDHQLPIHPEMILPFQMTPSNLENLKIELSFQGKDKNRVLLGETGKEKLPRYYKNIGLGFKTPKEAIEGTYIDKKCPFTGNVSIRGRILSGVVTKMKMQRTIVIRRDYLHYIRKHNRFEKRHKNMSMHLSPCFRDVQIGDIVTVGECRPLSKTVRFNVLRVTKAAGIKKQSQKF